MTGCEANGIAGGEFKRLKLRTKQCMPKEWQERMPEHRTGEEAMKKQWNGRTGGEQKRPRGSAAEAIISIAKGMEWQE